MKSVFFSAALVLLAAVSFFEHTEACGTVTLTLADNGPGLAVNLEVKLDRAAFADTLVDVDVSAVYTTDTSVDPFSAPGNTASLNARELVYTDQWSFMPTETGNVKVQIPYIRAHGEYDFCCGSIEGEIGYGTGGSVRTFESRLSPRDGEDIALVIDSTGSMQDDIDQVRRFSRDLVSSTFDSGSSVRFAIVQYNDPVDGCGFDASVVMPFSSNEEEILEAIGRFPVRCGGDHPEHVYDGILQALNLDWRTCSISSTITMGDAPPKDPEPGTGLTEDIIIDIANSVNVGANTDPFIPVRTLDRSEVSLNSTSRQLVTSGDRIRVKVPGAHPLNMILIGSDASTERSFTALAEGTGGKLFKADGSSDIVEVLTEAISASLPDPTPVPVITNTEDLVASLQCGSPSDPEYKVIIANPNSFPVKFTWRDFRSGARGGGVVSPPSTVVSVRKRGGLVFSLTWEQVENGRFKTQTFPFSSIPACSS